MKQYRITLNGYYITLSALLFSSILFKFLLDLELTNFPWAGLIVCVAIFSYSFGGLIYLTVRLYQISRSDNDRSAKFRSAQKLILLMNTHILIGSVLTFFCIIDKHDITSLVASAYVLYLFAITLCIFSLIGIKVYAFGLRTTHKAYLAIYLSFIAYCIYIFLSANISWPYSLYKLLKLR